MSVSLQDQWRCAERELALRRQVAPRLIATERLSLDQAMHELAALAAICGTLKYLCDAQAGQTDLWAHTPPWEREAG